MTIRPLLKRAAIFALDCIPLRILHIVRNAHQRRATRFTAALLRFIRHRHLRGLKTLPLADLPYLHLHNDDSHLARHVYWFGRSGYEYWTGQLWRSCVAQAESVLEIGANIGIHTLAQRDGFGHYTAVEANPDVYESLCINLELNNMAHRVHTIQGAVVGRPITHERLRFTVPNTRDPSDGALGEGPGKQYAVDAISIVDLCERLQPDLIKMDVEGIEAELITALWDYINDARPTLFVEVLRYSPNLRRIINEACLRDNGYKAYACAQGAPELTADMLKQIDLAAVYGSSDIMLTVREQ